MRQISTQNQALIIIYVCNNEFCCGRWGWYRISIIQFYLVGCYVIKNCTWIEFLTGHLQKQSTRASVKIKKIKNKNNTITYKRQYPIKSDPENDIG